MSAELWTRKLLSLASILALVSPLAAHHGWSTYDLSQSVSVVGKVARIELKNPHAWMILDVKDTKGAVSPWTFDLGGAGLLNRQGWDKDLIKTGDELTVRGCLSRLDEHRVAASEVVFKGKTVMSFTCQR